MIIGCMCAYQCADTIGQALEAALPYVDRMIVVEGAWDTFGEFAQSPTSTDGTLSLALSLGAEVIEPPGRAWHDQIEARNQYLVGSNGDWYLIVDADEILRGNMPDLNGCEYGAWLVKIMRNGKWFRPHVRLIKHGPDLHYRYAHFAVYRDNRLIDQACMSQSLWIDHLPVERERARFKAGFYRREHAIEAAWFYKGRPPDEVIMNDDFNRIEYEYIGGKRWLPGVPARNLNALEAARFRAMVEENMAGPHPLYRKVEPEPEPEPEPKKETKRRSRVRRTTWDDDDADHAAAQVQDDEPAPEQSSSEVE